MVAMAPVVAVASNVRVVSGRGRAQADNGKVVMDSVSSRASVATWPCVFPLMAATVVPAATIRIAAAVLSVKSYLRRSRRSTAKGFRG